MSISLRIPRPGWNSIAIIYICNHLYKIYYVFKKEYRCVVVIEKEKDAKGDKGEIYACCDMSEKSA